MDRRRWIILGFVVALVVATIDVYSNGMRLFGQGSADVDVRRQEVSDAVVASRTVTELATDVTAFVLATGVPSRVTVIGGKTEEVTIDLDVRVRHKAEGDNLERFENFAFQMERNDGELRVKIVPDELRRDVEFDWHISLPARLDLDIRAVAGMITVKNMQGSHRIQGQGQIRIEPAAAAPMNVKASAGNVEVNLPRHALNYDLQAKVTAGFLNVYHPEGTERSAGMGLNTKITLGGGEFPMSIEVNTGELNVRVTD